MKKIIPTSISRYEFQLWNINLNAHKETTGESYCGGLGLKVYLCVAFILRVVGGLSVTWWDEIFETKIVPIRSVDVENEWENRFYRFWAV